MGRGGVPARSYEAPPSHAHQAQKALHLLEARVRCLVPCRVTNASASVTRRWLNQQLTNSAA